MVSIILHDPDAPGLIYSFPKKNSDENVVDVTEDNKRFFLEKSGQWVIKVDRTHLVLASSKLVQQKVAKCVR